MRDDQGGKAEGETEALCAALIDRAMALGAHDAGSLAAEDLVIEDRFAAMCSEQTCSGYGRGMSCPPHVMSPKAFRESLKTYRRVLAFKFDVPTEILLSSERHEIYRLLHKTAAALEREALAGGGGRAFGMAGGSCKTLFCGDHAECRVLCGNGECRHPESARPSMSGLGVHVQDLCGRLDWPMQFITQDTNAGEIPLGLVVGAVLLG